MTTTAYCPLPTAHCPPLYHRSQVDRFEHIHDFARAYGSLCWNLAKATPRPNPNPNPRSEHGPNSNPNPNPNPNPSPSPNPDPNQVIPRKDLPPIYTMFLPAAALNGAPSAPGGCG